ncbi:transcriptional antitermination N peptide [Erwinia sp. CGal63]|uniref:transcriptional antitermination N peptide n=1 Tax=Erwinia sp. CGal63 TaxID=2919889 RepID=UPI003008FAAD
MNRNQRRMAAFNAKKSAEQIGQQRFERKLTQAMTGCSDRVLKAVNAPSVRSKCESTSMCLPEVAKYQAGYRTIKNISAQ